MQEKFKNRLYEDRMIPDEYRDILLEKLISGCMPEGCKETDDVEKIISALDKDLNEIKKLNSPFVNAMFRVYFSTLSVEQAKRRNEELLSAHTNAAFGFKSKDRLRENDINLPNERKSLMMNLEVTPEELEALKQFLNEKGIRYRI